MYRLSENLFANIVIDGKQFPVEQDNLIGLVLHSHILIGVPTAKLVLADNSAFFVQDITMADGMEVTISIGENDKDSTTYRFRVFSYKQTTINGTTAYEIDCYWDAPKFMSDSTSKPYEGTSNSVIGRIAGECGLSYKGDSTSDSMVWIPHNDKYCNFAKKVANHGYAGDTSVMSMAIDLTGKLHYRDLARITPGGPLFTRQKLEGIFVQDARSIDNAGFFNHYIGYKAEQVDFTVLKAKYFNKEKSVQIKKLSNFLSLNTAVKGKMDKGRKEFQPIDAGNVHEKYQRAYYQNIRASAVYAFGQKIITDRNTGVNLYDPVQYRTSTTSGAYEGGKAGDAGDSGYYFVAGRAIKVSGANYSEALMIVRQGLNDDPSGTGTQE